MKILKNDKEYHDAFYNEEQDIESKEGKGLKMFYLKKSGENYIKFQQQNRWMNENISQDDLISRLG